MTEYEQALAVYEYLKRDKIISINIGGGNCAGWEKDPPVILFGRSRVRLEKGDLRMWGPTGRSLDPRKDEKSVRRLLGLIRKAYRNLIGDWSQVKTLTDRVAFDALIKELTCGLPPKAQKRVLAQSLLAADDPAAYVNSFPERMKARGLDPSRDDLHVFALLDSAIDAGIADELDWRASHEEIARAFVRLGRSAHVDISSVVRSLGNKPAKAVLRGAAERIKNGPFRLFLVDIKSDCYPILLVRSDKIKAVLSYAKKARVSLKPFGKSGR